MIIIKIGFLLGIGWFGLQFYQYEDPGPWECYRTGTHSSLCRNETTICNLSHGAESCERRTPKAERDNYLRDPKHGNSLLNTVLLSLKQSL